MYHVLIIEDEEVLAGMYRAKFEESGFKVSRVPSSEEALEFLEEERPDIILLDILLIEESGLVFLEKRREIEGAEEIPVVAFSNYDDVKTRTKAYELGAKEYLLKTGHTPKDIVETLRRHLA